jgi:methylenetetrahydrofolate reductase (NADPH)
MAAYGDLDGYGISLKYPAQDCLTVWNCPESQQAINDLFCKYINNEIEFLPWSDSPLAIESSAIKDKLMAANKRGFLTINSQPAVDGASSTDPVHGWGPKNGYVYQKAYLEFFISPDRLDKLMERIGCHPYLTFYAVNRHGDLKTNTQTDGPNAVTWGVFPGQEIVQPTVVEAVSFLAWKASKKECLTCLG